MINAMLKVEFFAGDSIEEAIIEAKKLARKNDCWIGFSFNGVNMIVYENTNINEKINDYKIELKRIK